MSFTIGEVSTLLNIRNSTLHYYERVGILPNIEKNSSGHRVFSTETVEFLKVVRCMRQTGMGITDIKNYVALCEEGDDSITTRQAIFIQQKKVLHQQLKELNDYIRYVDHKISYYQKKLD